MKESDKRKIISYFERLEHSEGRDMRLEIGTMMTDMNYGRDGVVLDGTDGVVIVDFKLHNRNGVHKENKEAK